ncbi:hypothetical protein ACGF4C_22625 [Streptomyces sp. NPDC048197]|uniref:hypothetical protein n=1 Tax=Streptomyces sp. NPDC048197 TaxID=3365511 RepID=UPI003715BB1B
MDEQQQDQEREWANNPRLEAWISEQRAAFNAHYPPEAGDWDFSVESLDRLEASMRRRFSSCEEIKDERDSGPVGAATWYLGEVHVRTAGAQWQYGTDPDPAAPEYDQPYVTVPYERIDEYPPADDDPAQDGRPLTVPGNELCALFLRGPDNHLRDTLTRYHGAPVTGNDAQ